MEALVGLAGVLLGGLIAIGKDVWIGRADRDRSARYLAIRVSCALDRYIEECLALVLDDGLSFGVRNERGEREPQEKVPDPICYPDDLDWRSIDASLMYRLLSLPSQGASANATIRAASDHAFPPDYEEYFEACRVQYTSVGLAAASLAHDLRQLYNIPLNEHPYRDPVERLRREREKLGVDGGEGGA